MKALCPWKGFLLNGAISAVRHVVTEPETRYYMNQLGNYDVHNTEFLMKFISYFFIAIHMN